MPLFAGLQQFMEGNVWWGVNTGNPGTTLLGAVRQLICACMDAPIGASDF